MKLYEIPRGSELRLEVNGHPNTKCIFHHLDGMYSYCTVEDPVVNREAAALREPEKKIIFHLWHYEELTLVGTHYELSLKN